MTLAKSTVGAVGSVLVGVKDGVVVASSNVRDNTVDYVQHRYGDDAAQATGNSMNIVGDGVQTTWNFTRIAVVTTTGGLVIKTAISGVSGQTADAHINSGSWMNGECSIKNWGTGIWAVRHLHAKSSALLWYAKINGQYSKVEPDGFVTFKDIREVIYPAESEQSSYPYVMKIPQQDYNLMVAFKEESEALAWVHNIRSLGVLVAA